MEMYPNTGYSSEPPTLVTLLICAIYAHSAFYYIVVGKC